LDGYEIRPLTLNEEHRLKISEKGVLKKMFGPKREKL
jgi:hypothetical protein